MPDLAVEIRDRVDTDALLSRRVSDFLTAGVRVVWLVEPEAGRVTEFRQDQPDRVYVETDSLTIDDVIPGFSLPVRDALQT
jgi:Uma2 family endonuclease